MNIDVKNLRLTKPQSLVTVSNRLPKHKKGERFLLGPIPWTWLQRAASCPGHAIHVGIFLWWLAGMKKTAELKLDVNSVEQAFGIGRHTVGRALDHLTAAGLIMAERHTGRKPRVTLLPCSDQAQGHRDES
jgi:hypothetical protein